MKLNQVDGGSVLLPCSVTGTPTPIISWFDATGNRVDGRDPRFRTTSNGLLQIRGLRASDSGTYVCNASNSGGSINVRVTLNVHCTSIATIVFFSQNNLSFRFAVCKFHFATPDNFRRKLGESVLFSRGKSVA